MNTTAARTNESATTSGYITTASEADIVESAVQVTITGLSFIPLVLIAFFHFQYHYQDLYTRERRSVKHRRNPPELTPAYKLVTWMTSLTVLTAILANIGNEIGNLPSSFGHCKYTFNTATAGYYLIKLETYLIFALRLHLVYDGSPYEIGKNKLICTSVFLIIYTFAIVIVYIVLIGIEPDNGFNNDAHDDGFDVDFVDVSNSEYFNLCKTIAPEWYASLIGGVDFLVNVVYVILFVIPIRKLAKSINLSSRSLDDKDRLIGKMLVIGIKVYILSLVLFLTTLVAIGIYLATYIAVFSVDQIINITCLILMTPYYPNRKYYLRLCCCCIFCCDRKGYTKRKYYSGEIDLESGEERGAEASMMNSQMDSARDSGGAGDSNTDNNNNNNNNSNNTDMDSKNDHSTVNNSRNDTVDTASAVRLMAAEQTTNQARNQERRHLSPNEQELAENLQ